MSELFKAGLAVAMAIVIATAAWIYFSPFQTCMRGTAQWPSQMTYCLSHTQ